MNIKFKKNEEKERINNEIRNKLEYLSSIGPGEEYQDCLEELKELYELKKRMSLTYKMKEAFPWVGLAVTAIGTIGVPITMGVLAYRSSEEQGKLKQGDVWREAIQNQMHPQTPNITDNM